MSREEYKPPSYPVVRFLAAHGVAVSMLLGLVPLVAGIYLALIGGGLVFAVAGFFAGAVVGGLLVSYVEVLRIIADTLIPR